MIEKQNGSLSSHAMELPMTNKPRRPVNYEGIIVWDKPTPEGRITVVRWDRSKRDWVPVLDRADVTMHAPYASDDDLIEVGLDPKMFE